MVAMDSQLADLFIVLIFLHHLINSLPMRYWWSGWGERLGVAFDPGSTPTLPIIFSGIQVKGEYG
ncbi:hypothetical protein Hanom_Chr02g00151311 [Helianthus anomalus]